VKENNEFRAVIITELSHHAYCTFPYRDQNFIMSQTLRIVTDK